MTDHDIMQMSNGALKEPLMLNSKNLEPEDGGLFDAGITGGVRGNKWAHYRLAEPIVNPVFENPVRVLLGINKNDFNAIHSGAYTVKRKSKGVYDLFDSKTNKFVKTIRAGAELVDDLHDDHHEEEDDLGTP
jgi:DNA-directed RNA polymerase beta' subunit